MLTDLLYLKRFRRYTWKTKDWKTGGCVFLLSTVLWIHWCVLNCTLILHFLHMICIFLFISVLMNHVLKCIITVSIISCLFVMNFTMIKSAHPWLQTTPAFRFIYFIWHTVLFIWEPISHSFTHFLELLICDIIHWEINFCLIET